MWSLQVRDFLFWKASSAVKRASGDNTQTCHYNKAGCCSCPKMWFKMHRADKRKTEGKKKKRRSGKIEQALNLESLIPIFHVAIGQPRLGRERSLITDWLLIQGNHLLPSIARHLLIRAGIVFTIKRSYLDQRMPNKNKATFFFANITKFHPTHLQRKSWKCGLGTIWQLSWPIQVPSQTKCLIQASSGPGFTCSTRAAWAGTPEPCKLSPGKFLSPTKRGCSYTCLAVCTHTAPSKTFAGGSNQIEDWHIWRAGRIPLPPTPPHQSQGSTWSEGSSFQTAWRNIPGSALLGDHHSRAGGWHNPRRPYHKDSSKCQQSCRQLQDWEENRAHSVQQAAF